MKPYFIFTPDWSNYSAGVVVLHTLAHRLSKMGLEVFLHTEKQNPNWEPLPIINEFKGSRKNVIAVYPDIVTGNPYGCGTVSRYLLHLPGFFGGPKSFNKKDLLFVHSDVFNSRIGLPQERVLYFPYLDTNTFYDMNLQRKYKFYFRRAEKKDNYPDPQIVDIPSIGTGKDNASVLGQIMLAKTLNQTKVLYCYDNITAMVDIARLCGCAVVLIPDGFWTKDECKGLFGWHVGGIGYGLESEEETLKTVSSKEMRKFYTKEMELQGEKRMTTFVKITQEGR